MLQQCTGGVRSAAAPAGSGTPPPASPGAATRAAPAAVDEYTEGAAAAAAAAGTAAAAAKPSTRDILLLDPACGSPHKAKSGSVHVAPGRCKDVRVQFPSFPDAECVFAISVQHALDVGLRIHHQGCDLLRIERSPVAAHAPGWFVGAVKVPRAAGRLQNIMFTFDNTYSYVRPKTVLYTVRVVDGHDVAEANRKLAGRVRATHPTEEVPDRPRSALGVRAASPRSPASSQAHRQLASAAVVMAAAPPHMLVAATAKGQTPESESGVPPASESDVCASQDEAATATTTTTMPSSSSSLSSPSTPKPSTTPTGSNTIAHTAAAPHTAALAAHCAVPEHSSSAEANAYLPIHPNDLKKWGRLGNLTANETAALACFRPLVNADRLRRLKIPGEQDDTCLLRYLRANDFNVVESLAQFTLSFKWLRDSGYLRDTDGEGKGDSVRPTCACLRGVPLATVLRMYPIGVKGTDRQGRPLQYKLLGKVDSSLIGKNRGQLPPEALTEFEGAVTARVTQRVFAQCAAASGYHVEQAFSIIDMADFGFWDFTGKVSAATQAIIRTLGDTFPEVNGGLFVINAPWYFRAPWALVKGFIEPATVAKVRIHSDGAAMERDLHALVDPRMLPVEYGGTGELGLHSVDDLQNPETCFHAGSLLI